MQNITVVFKMILFENYENRGFQKALKALLGAKK